jgi:hypothetical protein
MMQIVTQQPAVQVPQVPSPVVVAQVTTAGAEAIMAAQVVQARLYLPMLIRQLPFVTILHQVFYLPALQAGQEQAILIYGMQMVPVLVLQQLLIIPVRLQLPAVFIAP